MIACRTILIVCLALFLSSCAATPILTGKGDMAREIKQKAPIVDKVDVSPDGRYVLSGGLDSFILWDILQGKKIQTFAHPKTSALWADRTAVAFSPDGKYFASGSKGTKLWDLSTRQEITTFDDNRAWFVTFSPDGKHILCGSAGEPAVFSKSKPPTMKIFDVETKGEIKDFKLQNFVYSAVYSLDGKHILSGGQGRKMTLWDISMGKPIKEAVVGSVQTTIAISPDGEYILSGGTDNSVTLWNANNLTQIKRFVGHTGMEGISSVAFSPDGKYGLSAAQDGKIIIWDLVSGAEWKALTGHTIKMGSAFGISAKFSPNGKQVISAGDASTRIWDVSTGEEVASMIAFEDGEWIITSTNGYYTSSPKGDQYLGVTVGGKEYSADQFA